MIPDYLIAGEYIEGSDLLSVQQRTEEQETRLREIRGKFSAVMLEINQECYMGSEDDFEKMRKTINDYIDLLERDLR